MRGPYAVVESALRRVGAVFRRCRYWSPREMAGAAHARHWLPAAPDVDGAGGDQHGVRRRYVQRLLKLWRVSEEGGFVL